MYICRYLWGIGILLHLMLWGDAQKIECICPQSPSLHPVISPAFYGRNTCQTPCMQAIPYTPIVVTLQYVLSSPVCDSCTNSVSVLIVIGLILNLTYLCTLTVPGAPWLKSHLKGLQCHMWASCGCVVVFCHATVPVLLFQGCPLPACFLTGTTLILLYHYAPGLRSWGHEIYN